MLTHSFVGTREAVRDGLQSFLEQTRVDELFVVSAVYDHSARLRSYELVAEVCGLREQTPASPGS